MKVDLIKILKKKYPRLKKKKINKNLNLTEDLILDSLELVDVLTYLENKYNFSIKLYIKHNKKFTINLIEEYIK